MTEERMPSMNLMSRLWPFLALLGLLALVTFPSIDGIVNRWLKLDESYSHGILLAAAGMVQ